MSGSVIVSLSNMIEEFWNVQQSLQPWPAAWSPTQSLPQEQTPPPQLSLQGNMATRINAESLQRLFQQSQDNGAPVIKMMQECNGGDHDVAQRVDQVRRDLYQKFPQLENLDRHQPDRVDMTPPLNSYGTDEKIRNARERLWAHQHGFSLNIPWGKGPHDHLVAG